MILGVKSRSYTSPSSAARLKESNNWSYFMPFIRLVAFLEHLSGILYA